MLLTPKLIKMSESVQLAIMPILLGFDNAIKKYDINHKKLNINDV